MRCICLLNDVYVSLETNYVKLQKKFNTEKTTDILLSKK